MGLLSEGKPLSWADTKKNASIVRRVGVKQFLALYHKLRERKGDVLKWGDEVSRNRHFFAVVVYAHAGRKGKLLTFFTGSAD